MRDDRPTFNRGAVRPVECLRGGWQLIKGDYWLFTGIAVVGVLIASLGPMGVLVGPIMCGIYICLFRKERGEPVKFEMLFQGFNYFLPGLVATLLMMIPVLVIVVPAYILLFVAMFTQMPAAGQPGQPPPPPDPEMVRNLLAGFGVVFLAVMVVSLLLQVLFFFTYPLIVDRKLTGVQALGTSFRAARANFGGVLGLVLLTGLVTLLGMLACYVGAVFVMAVHFAAVAVAYRQVFPRDDDRVPSVSDRPPPVV